MNSKIQKKINYLNELKNKISLWSDKTEDELEYLIKEFEKMTRAEISSYFFPYFKDNSFAEILLKITNTYSENKKITLNIISSLCNMVLRYDLEETNAIYNFVLETSNNKSLAGYVSIYLPNLKGFEKYHNKWQYFVSLKKMIPKKIAHQNLVKIIESNIDDIPSEYKQEIIDFLQEKYEMANNEGGKNYYQDMINRLDFKKLVEKTMNYLLKKEDFTLQESRYISTYEFEDENFKVTIYKEDFTQEEIDFTNKLINLYEETLPKIASFCVKSETFKYCYPDEDVDSIIKKLGKPIFRRMGNATLLTYTEHTIDYNHILDIEFEGLYEDFNIGIDG